jgi:uncharacterized protein (TIGR02453 family)
VQKLQKEKFNFNGFYPETLDFFRGLKENNNKEWFEQNQKAYQDFVMAPARDYILAMGDILISLSPEINADPRANKSLFRINRDTRFSNDKTPYKTHLGIVFWEADLPRMESSVFYFHLEDQNLMLGAGIYKFTKPQLEQYRKSVVQSRYGDGLTEIFKTLSLKGYDFGGKNYKKVPSGYDASHKNAGLLLYDGLYASKNLGIPDEFYSGNLIGFCLGIYRELSGLQKWLSELTKRS